MSSKQIKLALQKCKNANVIHEKNGYADGTQWRQDLGDLQDAENEVVETFRCDIATWLKHKQIDASIRMDISGTSEMRQGKLGQGFISIFNNKDGIQKTGWMNKITVNHTGKVISHKARTDKKFLHPLEQEFSEFVAKVYREVNTSTYFLKEEK